jgi:membrane protein DedA with SNARE-associated domain
MFDPLAIFEVVSADRLAELSALSIFAALFLGTFISEDAACIVAGALVATGDVSLTLALASCFLGIVAGDLGLYVAGRLIGRRMLNFEVARRFVTQASLRSASRWLDQRGASAIFLSRFVTGFRLPTYLAAGVLRTDFRKFALYFILASALWTPLIVGSVAFFGNALGGGVLIVAVGTFLIVRLTVKLASWRQRRLLVGKLRRTIEWEFWPLWVFYLPVVCYVLWLGLRCRSLSVFTCANPAIPAGGFAGESKDDIYSIISTDSRNREFLLRHCLIRGDITPGRRTEIAREFISAHGLTFPLVLKPDAGERGKGVRILERIADLDIALESIERDHVLQEFCDGGEISVFYFRHPGSESGEIFSMTEKVFPTVTGDGVSSVEQLILRDRRAVCLAEKYFEANEKMLDTVPAASETIPLIRIGTHSRGAIFREGIHLKTAAFERSIDEICRRIDGFYFGRFDIRYTSLEQLQAGRGFKIIELNGVTSESTNIYDPRYTLLDAYRILFRQWRIAFEIGAANRKRGVPATTLPALFRLAFTAVYV